MDQCSLYYHKIYKIIIVEIQCLIIILQYISFFYLPFNFELNFSYKQFSKTV